MKKYIVITIVLVAIAALAAFRFDIINKVHDGITAKPIAKPIAIQSIPTPVLVPIVKRIAIPSTYIIKITVVDLEQDLIDTYKHISSKQRKVLLDVIMEASVKYNVSPLVLYSIISIESGFRFQILHNPTTIRVSKKKVKIQAIGGTGIVYEIWGDMLKEVGIIETRYDLFDPSTNIMACAFIFDHYKQKPLKKGTKNPSESAMRRYFGGNFKAYSDKIQAKMGRIIFKKIYK